MLKLALSKWIRRGDGSAFQSKRRIIPKTNCGVRPKPLIVSDRAKIWSAWNRRSKRPKKNIGPVTAKNSFWRRRPNNSGAFFIENLQILPQLSLVEFALSRKCG